MPFINKVVIKNFHYFAGGIENMAVKIRLARFGSKKRPFYRVVAIDSQRKREGRALEYLGHYNPMMDPPEIKIDLDRVRGWISKGAQPTETVVSLLRKAGFYKES